MCRIMLINDTRIRFHDERFRQFADICDPERNRRLSVSRYEIRIESRRPGQFRRGGYRIGQV